jgi:hypothetical protein
MRSKPGLVELDAAGTPVARSKRGRPMPWETFTGDLLWARAATRLIRRLAPDCLTATSDDGEPR